MGSGHPRLALFEKEREWNAILPGKGGCGGVLEEHRGN